MPRIVTGRDSSGRGNSNRRRLALPAILLCLLPGQPFAALGREAQDDDAAAAEAAQPVTIRLSKDRIQLVAPEAWEQKEPQTRILDYEFAVPAADGDETAGRVTIMGAGGGVEANIQRWQEQFVQPGGGSTREKTRVDKQQIAGADVHIVSITGTYKDRPGGGPFTNTPVVLRENYRMLAAIVVTPKAGHYFIKLYGPAKTVDAQEQAFRATLDGLKISD
jgi:hypothetical protein